MLKKEHKKNSLEKFLDSNHQIPTIYSKDGVAIELHERITSPRDFHSCSISKKLYKRAVRKKLFGSEIYVPSAPDSVLHQVIHTSYQNNFSLGILSLFDIRTLLSNYPKINLDSLYEEIYEPSLRNYFLLMMGILKKETNLNDLDFSFKKDMVLDQSIYQIAVKRLIHSDTNSVSADFLEVLMKSKGIIGRLISVFRRFFSMNQGLVYKLGFFRGFLYSFKEHLQYLPVILHKYKQKESTFNELFQLISWAKKENKE